MNKIYFLFVSLALVSCAHRAPLKKDLGGQTMSPKVQKFILKEPPLIGTTEAGQKIYLGGFSGLRFLGETERGEWRFATLTDRGPNSEESEVGGRTLRPFLLPDFQPRVVYLLADPATGLLKVEKEMGLKRANGKPISGLPQEAGQESGVTAKGEPLDWDRFGMDSEALDFGADGSIWVSEEYGPGLFRFDKSGTLLEVFRPGNGLPLVLKNRRLNRGFEGMTVVGESAFILPQSPLDVPSSVDFTNSKKSKHIRMVELDMKERRTVGQYLYVLDTRADRIGDMATESKNSVVVVERDGKSGAASFKRVYRVRWKNATNLQELRDSWNGAKGRLELATASELEAAGIGAVSKELMVDLTAHGIMEEKVEGVDLVGDKGLAVIIDNDFGLAGPLDTKTGIAEMKDEPSALYFIPKARW
jgi:hypothetical protein